MQTGGFLVLPKQREAKILADLEELGVVTVNELAERLAVTGETIRRDLTKLAERGRLVRTHGGAVAASDQTLVESPFAVRKTDRGEQKRALGQAAALSVAPGQIIAVDASTTCLELARQLAVPQHGPNITVVSNGLDVVRWLAGRAGVEVICTGGEFDADGACFVGPVAESTLRQFSFDRAFVSCRGYDLERGASEASPAHASLKRQMLEQSKSAWLLVDASKVGSRSACYVGETESFDVIACEAQAPDGAPSGVLKRWRLVAIDD